MDSVESTRPATDAQLERIREASRHDAQLQKLMDVTLKGWPAGVEDVPYLFREFFDLRGHLSVRDALLTYDDRIVIPASMREEMVERIHTGHQGITKCRERANLSVWWPGISKEIKSKVQLCHFCQENQASQGKEPLIATVLPDRPWQKVSTDLFELTSRKYLVVMDYSSRFIEILTLVGTTSQTTSQTVSVCTMGCPRRTNKRQRHTV